MNSKLLIFGSKNFNNSINEVKEFLNFSLDFFDFTTKSYFIDPLISAIIVDSKVLDLDNLCEINKIHNKPILLLDSLSNNKKCNYTHKILLPTSLIDLNNIILDCFYKSQNSIVSPCPR